MPIVSVVVPTYRRPWFLREALASVVGQTWTDLEVLVCDNGADPQTAAVVAELADPRVRHLPRERDLGMLRNAVEGFRAARGAFVVKLDDDDTLAPDALALLLPPLLADPGLTVAFASFDLVDEAGERLDAATDRLERGCRRRGLAPGRHVPFVDLAAAGAVALTCAVVRKDAVDWDGFPDDVATSYDRHVVLQCARGTGAAWYEPASLARYRIHAGSDTNTATLRQALGALAADERALAAGEHADVAPLVASANATALTAGRLLLRAGETARARRLLLRAVRRRPDPLLVRLLGLAALPPAAAARIARGRWRRADPAAAQRPPEE